MVIDGGKCIFAEPSAHISLAAIRKQQKLLENLTGMVCVLELSKINGYAKKRLIEVGIPFVIQEKRIYLSFLGVALSREDERIIKPCERISFLTQKLLLTSIYEKWKDVSVSKAAERLSVAKISVTRCYDEIEAIGLPYIKKIQIVKRKCANRLGVFYVAAKALKASGVFGKLPDLAKLKADYKRPTAEKDELYTEYDKLKKQLREYDTTKQNIDSILPLPVDTNKKRRCSCTDNHTLFTNNLMCNRRPYLDSDTLVLYNIMCSSRKRGDSYDRQRKNQRAIGSVTGWNNYRRASDIRRATSQYFTGACRKRGALPFRAWPVCVQQRMGR